ncbi:MAG: DUF5050 domain-containing protein [Solirubrobacteraceae bacterium]
MTQTHTLNTRLLQYAALLLLASGLIAVLPATLAHAASTGKNGKLAFHTDRDGNLEIYTMNLDGSGQTRLTNNAANDAQPFFSPDGRKIAFSSTRDGGNYEIYTMNADGTNQIRLTNNPAFDAATSWSPDGNKIAFHSIRDGNLEIYTMNADGTNQTRLTNNAAEDSTPDWSPDGSKLAFQTYRDGNYEIYTMNADGTNLTRLTNNAAIDYIPNWSPDGSKIAFTSYRDGNYEIYTMNADGTNQIRLTNNAAEDSTPIWSPDGSKIAFSSTRDGGNYEIYAMNADGTNQIRLTINPAFDVVTGWQPLIGTTIQDPNDPNRIITTIPANENYPILDYTVEPNQTLVLDGSLCDVTVSSGGILMGTGTACSITVEPGGTIAPGHSPGCLSSGNLSLSGTYIAELAGTTACTQYDQLQVTGTVTVGGNLSVSLLNGFIPTAGSVFTLIANDGTDPVTGTFAGLAEGTTVSINGTAFRISYVGGTGNDVTLTALTVPAAAAIPGAPNTGIERSSVIPSLVLATAGASLALGALHVRHRRRGNPRSL